MATSIRKNLGLQTVYQILITSLPLITAPYLSRVLGASSLGIYSFTSSVVQYFTLFAMLGTVNYGTRAIALVKSNKGERSKSFWSILALQVFATSICAISYTVYMIVFCKENQNIAWIQGIAVISCLFDITWLYFGIEEFKVTVIRSMVIKILTVLSILSLVKKPEDLLLYTLSMAIGTLANQVVLWRNVLRYVSFVKITVKDVLKHIKPNLILFIPLLAMSVYHIMDKTMLGALSSYEQSGYYYNADKLINIPLCIINGVGTVMLPRMTALFNSGKRKEGNPLFLVSLEGVALVSIAMACGIAAISREFVPFFFGYGYDACIALTIVLSPVLVIKGLTNTVRTQYLIPLNKEKYYTNSVLSGAVTNLVFNLLLIPKFGAMGAVLGTLLAELVSCLVQFLVIVKDFKLGTCLRNCGLYFIAGIIMFFTVRTVSMIHVTLLLKLAIEIIVGALIFIIFSGLIIYKTKSQIYQELFAGIIRRIPFIRRFTDKGLR